jgi:hypothetical protein
MLVAAAGGLIAFAAAWVALTALGPATRTGDTSPTTAPSYMSPPEAEVQRVRDALSDIGARCTPQAGDEAVRRLDHDADVVLDFARRYPNAEFTVDDESGHTLSLLLAVRDDLSHCAPAAAARVDAAVPSQFRQQPPATSQRR